MQSKKRLFEFSLLLTVAGFLFVCCVGSVANATTVSVTDLFAPHTTYARWQQFSTDLSGVVTDPPASHEETTVTGPTWNWTITSQAPAQPGFTLVGADNHNDHCTLQSPTPSTTVSLIAAGGTYTINVTATAVYTQTDPLGNITYPKFTGSQVIQFFDRVPKLVVQTGHRDNNNPVYSKFPLAIVDNESPPQNYGLGLSWEVFSNIVAGASNDQPNGTGDGDAWSVDYAGPPGQETTTGTGGPVSTFTDSNYHPNNPNADPKLLEFSFDQTFHCMEYMPPYPSQELYVQAGTPHPGPLIWLPQVNDTPLGNTMHIEKRNTYVVRNYLNDPFLVNDGSLDPGSND